VRDRVRALIAQVLGLDEVELPPSLTPQTVGAWDSLHHFELMLALETEFGLTIRGDEMPNLTSDEAIAEYVQQAAAVHA
jgi:acyl carrier protein